MAWRCLAGQGVWPGLLPPCKNGCSHSHHPHLSPPLPSPPLPPVHACVQAAGCWTSRNLNPKPPKPSSTCELHPPSHCTACRATSPLHPPHLSSPRLQAGLHRARGGPALPAAAAGGPGPAEPCVPGARGRLHPDAGHAGLPEGRRVFGAGREAV